MKKLGFTLIELSIVLVIIGLIVGGVLVGRDLIRSAQLRAVVSELDKYEVAVKTFRTKYNCFPGDCADATSYFTNAVNGNNDGILCNGLANSFPVTNSCSYQFFLQLGQAGLIEGNNWPGTGSTEVPIVGTNIPASKALSGGQIGVAVSTVPIPVGGLWGYLGNVLWLGSNLPTNGVCGGPTNINKFWGPSLTPFEMYSIDQKADDGNATKGRMLSTGCTTTTPTTSCNLTDDTWASPPYTGLYRLTETRPACEPVIKLQ